MAFSFFTALTAESTDLSVTYPTHRYVRITMAMPVTIQMPARPKYLNALAFTTATYPLTCVVYLLGTLGSLGGARRSTTHGLLLVLCVPGLHTRGSGC
jgi:hypothetical protein